MPHRKHIYIAYTGGTIGMQRTARGYATKPGFIKQQMAQMPELKHAEMPRYTIHEYTNPIDSSNMTPTQWNKIAADIVANYDHYDGFIILHGTDTMAYTASALSFMLENLNKPVIITGSQLPLSEIRNDARTTLISALQIISSHPVPEVCIYFDNKLLRGNRTRKLDTHDFAAFGSPNLPALATIGIDVLTNKHLWLKPSKKALKLQTIKPTALAYLRLFPGMSIDILERTLASPLQGLILETYGSGNAPNDQRHFLKALKDACDRGMVIMNCTQCIRGSVNMEKYATGHTLQEIGIVSGYDMTPEATLTKLFYLFSKKLSVAAVKKQMQINLIGELT